jgi:hypothetical protein
VRHRDVAALRPVLMRVALVRHVPGRRALVNVVAVDAMNVSVVCVVSVALVRERDVAAALAVRMLMVVMRGVLGVCHIDRPSCPGLTNHQYINIWQFMHEIRGVDR